VKVVVSGVPIKMIQAFVIRLHPLAKCIYLYANILLWETKCN